MAMAITVDEATSFFVWKPRGILESKGVSNGRNYSVELKMREGKKRPYVMRVTYWDSLNYEGPINVGHFTWSTIKFDCLESAVWFYNQIGADAGDCPNYEPAKEPGASGGILGKPLTSVYENAKNPHSALRWVGTISKPTLDVLEALDKDLVGAIDEQRRAMLAGLAKEFMAESGLPASEIEMVETWGPGRCGCAWRFRKCELANDGKGGANHG